MESRNPYQSPEHDPSGSNILKARVRRASQFAGLLLSFSALSFVSAGLISSATFVPEAQRLQWELVIASVMVGAISLALSFYLYRRARRKIEQSNASLQAARVIMRH